jgi:hypothetical protein
MLIARKYGSAILFSLLVVFTLHYPLGAQPSITLHEDTDSQPHKITITLSRDVALLADDYLDVLRQLETLTKDYGDYFKKIQVELTDEKHQGLNLILNGLKDGSYLDDVEQAESDISALLNELKEKEGELAKRDRRASRLTRSLQQELGALQEILQQDILPRLQENDRVSKQISAYLRAYMSIPESTERDERKVVVVVVEKSDTLGVFPMTPEDKDIDISIGEIPPLPESTQPQVEITPETEIVQRTGKTSVVRKFADSVDVSSSKQTIYITNPIGDLIVTGWNQKRVLVSSTVELAAGTSHEAAEQIRQAELQVRSKQKGITVELVIPDLSDPDTKVIRSVLKVRSPEGNPIECTSAFGKTSIRKMRDDVTLTASRSQVVIEDVTGNTEVTNAMEAVELNDVTGDIKATNSYGPVKLSRCRGDMEIQNAFAAVEIKRSDGDVSIRNNGPVEILRHAGRVEIENSNGRVLVSRFTGELGVTNAFGEVSLRDINGTTTVENTNGTIEAEDIEGIFTAQSAFGSILAGRLTGPIALASQNGTIELVLDRSLEGPSSISSTYGTVKLALSPETDVQLTAKTMGGEIQSSLPLTLTATGLEKTARLTLGRGTNELMITGTNSSIIITELK